MADAVFKPGDLMGQQIFGIPVDREFLFSNHKNVYKNRVEKRQRKLIVKISYIKPFLQTGEQILLITTGYSPLNSAAQYLTGFIFTYLKRALLVFTNYRIFHIPTTADYNYKHSMAQVAYAGCESIELKGGSLIVRYGWAGNKKTDKFRAIGVSERRKLRVLLQKKPTNTGTKGRLSSRIHLCPRCTQLLSARAHKCSKCQLQFKSKFFTAILALFIPGGGYLYMRHYLLGCLDALLEIVSVALIIYLANEYLNQMPVNPLYLLLIPAFLYLKIVAVIHPSHMVDDVIPEKKKFQVQQLWSKDSPI